MLQVFIYLTRKTTIMSIKGIFICSILLLLGFKACGNQTPTQVRTTTQPQPSALEEKLFQTHESEAAKKISHLGHVFPEVSASQQLTAACAGFRGDKHLVLYERGELVAAGWQAAVNDVSGYATAHLSREALEVDDLTACLNFIYEEAAAVKYPSELGHLYGYRVVRENGESFKMILQMKEYPSQS